MIRMDDLRRALEECVKPRFVALNLAAVDAVARAYVIEPSDESVQFIVDTMDPQNLSLIGTGSHDSRCRTALRAGSSCRSGQKS